MSKDPNKKEENQIDEERAYLELCQIIAEALETMDINLLQYRINEWKKKYPYEKFSKNLKAKIDFLLSQYYTEIINQILKTIKERREKKKFDQGKAMVKLYKIIKETNDLKELNKKVEAWKKEFPINDFMDMYKKRAKKYTSRKYLEENSFDTKKAFYDLHDTLNVNATYEELKEKVKVWEKDYRIGEKFKVEDFKGKSSEVKRMLDDEYLYSISKEDEKEDSLYERQTSLAIQTARYNEFINVIEKGNMAKTVEWIYKNRNIEFGDYYKAQIIAKTAFKYPLSKLDNTSLKLNLNERGLSFYEYQTIDESRRYIITEFIKNLVKDKTNDTNTFQMEFNKSQDAKNRNISSHEMIKQDLEKDVKDEVLDNTETIKKIEDETNKLDVEDENKDIKDISKVDGMEEKTETNNNITIEIANAIEKSKKEEKETEKEKEQVQLEEGTSTFVIDLDEEPAKKGINDDNDSKLQVTELETKPFISKEEPVISFVIVHPDFLKVACEKSRIADEMTQDNIKEKNIKAKKKGIKQEEKAEEKKEEEVQEEQEIIVLEPRSIMDIDRIASEAVQEERIQDEVYTMYIDLN